MQSPEQLLSMIGRLAAAFALGLPVGWEREHRSFSPGLRTFPLVALGSCGFLLMGQSIFPTDAGAQGYVFQAVLSGIGFIGGGAIIKGKGEIQGIATAVSLAEEESETGLAGAGVIITGSVVTVADARRLFRR